MAKWTTEKMVKELKILLGERLVSVVLYGSMASGDHAGKNSDVNLLVVTRHLMMPELQSLSKAVMPWVKQGNHPPLFLTQNHLKEFVSVFPIEILDIQNSHQVLFGIDPVEGFSVSNDHLKVQLQHELQAKLIRLKTHYMLTESRPSLVQKLMVDSLSSFLILFKHSLWLYGVKPPLKKLEALQILKTHVAFDLEVFEVVDRLKRGEKVPGLDVSQTFQKYLGSVEAIVNNVDRLG